MASITVQNVSKQYKGGEVQALRGVSFDVQDGEFFCILGPAGAGKTTLIKLIAGIEAADAGKIMIGDQDVTDRLPMERDVAVAFETYALYPQRTVRENLAFPLQAPVRRNEWTKEAIEARITEVANLLGISELLDRYPRQLSGGQRQRVALGRALVRKPKAYLLDEPIAHLDAKLRHRMRGELKRIQIEQGITTIYTTPDQLEALSLADRMAVLNHGKLEQVGTPDEIYKHPANIFVARFVGDPPMNILDASLDGEWINLADFGRLPATRTSKEILVKLHNSPQVKIGVRPRDLELLPVAAANALCQAEVKHVQVLGETSILTLTVGALELRSRTATFQAPERGASVGLTIHPERLHYFDANTQRNLELLPG